MFTVENLGSTDTYEEEKENDPWSHGHTCYFSGFFAVHG